MVNPLGMAVDSYRAVDSYSVGVPFKILLGGVIITDKTHTDWYLVPG